MFVNPATSPTTSDIIAFAAFVVAALALILGEVRARRTRKLATERNNVHWSLTWPRPDEFELVHDGPDKVRNVYIEIGAEHQRLWAIRKQMRAGEKLIVAVPQLAALWEITNWQVAGDTRWATTIVVSYGGKVEWDTPRGTHRERPLDGYFDNTRAPQKL